MKRSETFIEIPPSRTIFARLFLVICFLSAHFGAAAQNKSSAALEGRVRDEFGGLIVGGETKLKGQGRTETTVTDERGTFRFENLASGRYTLEVSAEGFALYTETFEIKRNEPLALSVVLYPTVLENVSVENPEASVLDTETLAGTQVISDAELDDLPDDPEELNRELQNRAASAGGVPGNAVVTVDGFLNEGRLPSKASIREVRVNPNLFSAEYDFPPFRGGRIEILTKPGAGAFSGEAFFNFNDDLFNARHPFAPERAETRTRLYGFRLGAPLIKDRAGLFFDFEKRDIDEASAVNAFVLGEDFEPASFTENVPRPQRLTLASVRGDWQIGKAHTLIFRAGFNSETIENLGVGGSELPTRASRYERTENNLRFSVQTVVNAGTFNEFRLGLTKSATRRTARTDASVIGVAGAFTSGGADLQNFSLDETDLEIADHLVTGAGKHILKLGAQVFYHGTDEFRLENQNGTFFFGGREIEGGDGSNVLIDGLEQYRRTLAGLPGGVPTRFSLTSGASSVEAAQWLVAGFIQDEWRVSKKLLISLGLRAETQTLPKDKIRFAPRLSIAFSPDDKQNWAVRARAGIFYERIGDALTLETRRLDGVQRQRILIDDPTFPDPFNGGNPVEPVTVRRVLDPNLKAPGSLQMRFEIQRQFPQGWSVSTSYSLTRGWSQFRSRNINAPLVDETHPDPSAAPRPFGVPVNIFRFESSGRLEGKVFYLGVNQNAYGFFSLNAGYLNFDFRTDADGAFSFPQTGYDLTNEFAAPFWQTRHRLFLSSSLELPQKMRLAVSVNANSGTPFDITTGRDNNGDGVFNDRPAISSADDPHAVRTIYGFLNPNALNGDLPRNAGTNPANFTVDINLRRTFVFLKQKEREYELTPHIRVENLFNRTNPNAVGGVLGSPFFGRAFAARNGRRIEFGLRFEF